MTEELYLLIKKAQGGRSQNHFALDCHINPSTFTKMLQGKFSPKIATLEKIAAASENRVLLSDLLKASGFDPAIPQIEGLYMRLARGAQELGLDDDDVDYILNFYKKYKSNGQ